MPVTCPAATMILWLPFLLHAADGAASCGTWTDAVSCASDNSPAMIAVTSTSIINGDGAVVDGDGVAARLLSVGTNAAGTQVANITFTGATQLTAEFQSDGSVESCTFKSTVRALSFQTGITPRGTISRTTFELNTKVSVVARGSLAADDCVFANNTNSDSCNHQQCDPVGTIEFNIDCCQGSTRSGYCANYVQAGVPVKLAQSTFVGNTANKGGVIYGKTGWCGNRMASNSPEIIFEDCLVLENEASTHGGAVHLEGPIGTAWDIKFVYGTVRSSSFIRNRAGSDGGAIFTSQVFDVLGCHFEENRIMKRKATNSGRGSSIHGAYRTGEKVPRTYNKGDPRQYTELRLSSSTFRADEKTGDAPVSCSRATVTTCHFESGKGAMAGALYMKTMNDPPMFQQPSIEPIHSSVQSCVFLGNAGKGPSVPCYHPDKWEQDYCAASRLGSSILSHAGAVHMQDATGIIRSCTFTSNAGGFGGAIRFADLVREWIEVSTCTFERNNATKGGGAIYHSSSDAPGKVLQFAECTFSANVATDGGAVYSNGTVPSLDSSATMLRFDACNFGANVAAARGGAVYCNGSLPLHLVTSTFRSNVAMIGGAILSIAAHTPVYVKNNVFQDNVADDLRNVNIVAHIPPTPIDGYCPPDMLWAAPSNGIMGACKLSNCTKPGHYEPGCVKCDSGHYCVDYVKHACPQGHFQRGRGESICEVCDAGTYTSATGQSICMKCEPGRFQPASGNSTCRSCAPGQFQAGKSATSCEACQDGMYQEDFGKTVCLYCDNCARGYNLSADAISTCGTGDKAAGGIAPEENTTKMNPQYCLTCAPGRYGDAKNLAVCKNCPLGFAASSSHGGAAPTTCDMCEAGQHADIAGLVECKLCPAGYSQPAPGNPTCRSCVAGSFSLQGNASCTSCPEGWRGHSHGCMKCSAGTYQSIPSSTLCLHCEPGTYQNSAEATVCAKCAKGTSQSAAGATLCLQCPSGQIARSDGAAVCSECGDVNTMFTAGEGATECLTCTRNAHVLQPKRDTCVCNNEKTDPKTGKPYSIQDVEYEPSYFEVGLVDYINARPNATASETSCKTSLVGGKLTVPDTSGCCRKCPVGALCVDGMIFITPGFFRAGGEDAARGDIFVSPCPNTYACPGDKAVKADTTSPGCTESHPCATGVTIPENQHTRNPTAANRRRQRAGRSSQTSGDDGICSQCADTFAAAGGCVASVPAQQSLVTADCLAAGSAKNGCSDAYYTGCNWPLRHQPETLYAQSGPCAPGHDNTSVLCAECLPGWKPGHTKMCMNCGGANKADDPTAKILVFTFGSLIVLAVVTSIVTRPDAHGRAAGLDSEKAEAVSEDAMEMSNHTDTLMTILPYVQRVSEMQGAFPFNWPAEFLSLIEWFKLTYGSVAKLFAVVGPCSLHMDFRETLAMQVSIVPWMCVIAVTAYAIAGLYRKYLKKQRAKLHMLRRESSRNLLGEKSAPASDGGKNSKASARARREKRRPGRRTAKRKKDGTVLRFQMSSVTIRLMMLLIFSVRFLYPGIGSTILKSFVCVNSPNGRVLQEMVSLECWTDEFWSKIGGFGLIAACVLLVGLPVSLAWAVIAERRTWLRQMADEKAEKSAAMDRLFKTQSITERLIQRAHSTVVQHHHKTVELRHKVIYRFIRRNKPEYWWWFLVEMLLSLFFIGILAIFNRSVGVQVSVGGAAACLQILLPAKLEPFAANKQNNVAVTAGVLYFIIYLSGLTNFLIQLHRGDDDKRDLENADNIIKLIIFVIVAGFIYVLCNALWEVGKAVFAARCATRKKGRNSKVVPIGDEPAAATSKSSKKKSRGGRAAGKRRTSKKLFGFLSGPTSRAKQGSGAEIARGRANIAQNMWAHYDDTTLASLRRIHPPTRRILETIKPSLRHEYLLQWHTLLGLHLEVVATAMQAVTRGFVQRQAARRKSALRGSVLELKGMTAEEKVQGASKLPIGMSKEEAAARSIQACARGMLLRAHAENERLLREQLAEEKSKEAALERQLDEELRKEAKLEKSLSSMRLRVMDKHLGLDKAADKLEAVRILTEHEAETAKHRAQLEQSKRKANRKSLARNKKKRLDRALAAFAVELMRSRDGLSKPRSEADIRALLDGLDADKDGLISAHELWKLVESMTLESGHAMTQDDAKAIVESLDADSSGDVSVDEVMVFIRERLQRGRTAQGGDDQ